MNKWQQEFDLEMVGAARIELATPTMSTESYRPNPLISYEIDFTEIDRVSHAFMAARAKPCATEEIVREPVPRPAGTEWKLLRGSVVYFIEGPGGLTKIGTTGHLKQRIACMTTGPRAIAVTVRAAFPGGLELERQLQLEFAADLARDREWFRWSPRMEARMDFLAAQYGGVYHPREGKPRRNWLFIPVEYTGRPRRNRQQETSP